MLKFSALLMFVALLAPAAAEAQIFMPQKDPATCQSPREGWDVAGGGASQNFHTCGIDNEIGEKMTYKALRLDPGRAAVPHEIYGSCFYIDNYSDRSFFIPAATPAEWASFVDNHPQLIVLTPCCRPDAAVQNDDTCSEPLDRSNYQRPGYSFDAQVGTYQARAVSLQCVLSNNGRSAQWDLQADISTPCDANLAAAPATQPLRARIQGVALIRNIPIGGEDVGVAD